MSASLTFGQGPGADVIVKDQYVSATHCRITCDAGRWTIEDFGSTNGTYVNRPGLGSIRVRMSLELKPGDKIRIGHTTLPWEVPA